MPQARMLSLTLWLGAAWVAVAVLAYACTEPAHAATATATGDIAEVSSVEPSLVWDFDIGEFGNQYQRSYDELEWGAKFAGQGEECQFPIAENDYVLSAAAVGSVMLTGHITGQPTAPLVPLEFTESINPPAHKGRAYHVDGPEGLGWYMIGGHWGCSNWPPPDGQDLPGYGDT